MRLPVRVHAGAPWLLITRGGGHEYCCLLLDCKQAFREVGFHKGSATIWGWRDIEGVCGGGGGLDRLQSCRYGDAVTRSPPTAHLHIRVGVFGS